MKSQPKRRVKPRPGQSRAVLAGAALFVFAASLFAAGAAVGQPGGATVCLIKTEPSGGSLRVAVPAPRAVGFEQKGFERVACPADVDRQALIDAGVARCARLRAETTKGRSLIEQVFGIQIETICAAAEARKAAAASAT